MSIDPRSVPRGTRHRGVHSDDPTFDALMAEQLRRTPWLLLSIVLHAVAVLLFLAIPQSIVVEEARAVALQPPPPPPPAPEDPPPPVTPPVEEPPVDPDLQDPTIPDDTTDQLSPEDFTDATVSALNDESWNTAIGIAGAAAGKFADRSGGRERLRRRRGGHDTALVIDRGLRWLAEHQDVDGKWDVDDFMKHDADGGITDGAGNGVHDVGVTGLALLAFLGDGTTLRSGRYQAVVKSGIHWLRQQQQPSGCIGSAASHDFIYDHSIAALAMVEAYGLSNYHSLRRNAQRAIDYLESHRNPYRVWRYQPADGDNDTSVTGWCVMAYKSAADFGLTTNPQAMTLAASWFDEVTDPATGRCGYSGRGEPSSRLSAAHRDRYPVTVGEAMTAVGLLCRFFLGQDPSKVQVMNHAADTILAAPPRWDADASAVDHYYWYYATYALYQMGRHHWDEWREHLTKAVLRTQRHDGNFTGSWDPAGVWGEQGGRVYSTAMLVLTLEAYYRYTRVLVR